MGTKEFILKAISDDTDSEIVWQLPMQSLCMEITNELVRCKDCKHRPVLKREFLNGLDLEFPTHECPCECDGDEYYSWMPEDDWYCPNGERKEE